MKILVVLLSIVIAVPRLSAQIEKKNPMEGYPSPNFSFGAVKYHAQDNVDLNDFKGKWLVLDFWSTYCGACLKSFPKIEQLSNMYKDSVQFLLVGLIDRSGYSKTSEAYERFRAKYDLTLPVAFDSTIFLDWKISMLPYYVIIDPNGIVRAITSEVSNEILGAVITGKAVSYIKAGYSDELNLPDLDSISKILDKDIVFQATLKKWSPGLANFNLPSRIYGTNKLELNGLNLESLIRYSIIGQVGRLNNSDMKYDQYYPHLIIESENELLFDSNLSSGKGMYSYNIILPFQAERDELMNYLKNDIERLFQLNIIIEEREVQCWNLVVDDGADTILRTQGGDESLVYDGYLGYTVKNKNIDEVVNILQANFARDELPFFNETRLLFNIDLKVDAIMTDFDDVKDALANSGLKLIKGWRRMPVIVVRDKQKQ